jgi:hypothetical protein
MTMDGSSLWLIPRRVLLVCGLCSSVLERGAVHVPTEEQTKQHVETLKGMGIQRILDLHHSQEPPRYPLTDVIDGSTMSIETIRLSGGGRIPLTYALYLPLARFLRHQQDGPVAINCGGNFEIAKLHTLMQLLVEGSGDLDALRVQFASLSDPVAASICAMPPFSRQQAQDIELEVLRYAEDDSIDVPPTLTPQHLQWQYYHDKEVFKVTLDDLADKLKSKVGASTHKSTNSQNPTVFCVFSLVWHVHWFSSSDFSTTMFVH